MQGVVLRYLLLEASEQDVWKPEHLRKGITWKGTEAEPWPSGLANS